MRLFDVPIYDDAGRFIVDHIDGQDIMVWATQGRIADRTVEHIGGSDRGIVLFRQMLKEQIRRWTSEPVNLIAHSMGGLDARYLISRLGMADQVRSLTTISTPHRGSFMADWFRANFDRRVPLLGALVGSKARWIVSAS